MTTPSTVRERLEAHARRTPTRAALSARSAAGGWETLTWPDLRDRVRAVAGRLAAAAPDAARTSIALPNGTSFFIAVLASWWAAKTPLILPADSSAHERETLLSGLPDDLLDLGEEVLAEGAEDVSPLPYQDPREGWYLPSGGSTGLPHLVSLSGSPAALLAGQVPLFAAMGRRPDATQLVLGPLSHAGPFVASMSGLFSGNHLVVIDRFAPTAIEDAVRRYPPTWCQTTPHQMAVLALDDTIGDAFGANLDALMHTAAPCPAEVKRDWIRRLGPDRVFELYGSTEIVGAVINSGSEWLERPGMCGRPFMTEIRIAGPDGSSRPPGKVGEVYMRTTMRRPAPADTAHLRSLPGGFHSVGDLGYVDEDGYLFLTDRVDDVILVGGANVSAREVENVLIRHPAVREALVVGRPHGLLGQTVCAVLVLASPVSEAEVQRHCERFLAVHKVPTSIETVPELERSRAGKVRRHVYR
jgi:bile acid-coenzyme A ligase